jgi:hypothetical protein
LGREKYSVLFKVFIWELLIYFVAKILEDVGRVIGVMSKKSASVHSIVVTTRLHKRTVKRYLELIEIIQNAPKLKKEVRGARVLFRMDV